MKAGKWIAVLLVCITSYTFAQADSIKPEPVVAAQAVADTNVRVIASPGVENTLQKVQQYQQLSKGTFSGYRIQIHFGQDRTNANKAKTDFANKYASLPSYLTYQQPYFKVCIGDFRTKLEAVRALNNIKKEYPGAFVVRDKINPPPLQ